MGLDQDQEHALRRGHHRLETRPRPPRRGAGSLLPGMTHCGSLRYAGHLGVGLAQAMLTDLA